MRDARNKLRRLVDGKGNLGQMAVALMGEARKQLEFAYKIQSETYSLRRVEESQAVTLKESIRVEPNGSGSRDLQSKILVGLFGLLAEVERDLISERTKAGLARARAEGTRLGRPKGVLGKSRLDGREAEIKAMLAKRVSKASLARILDVSPPTLRFITSRKIAL